MIHKFNSVTKFFTRELLFFHFYKLSTVFASGLISNCPNQCSDLIKSIQLSQQCFCYHYFSSGQLLSYSSYYGTALITLLFYSLVTIKQQLTRVIKTKEVVHFSLWTTLVMPFLRKVCNEFKRTIERPERLLYTLLASTQAIQTKKKQCQTYEATK